MTSTTTTERTAHLATDDYENERTSTMHPIRAALPAVIGLGLVLILGALMVASTSAQDVATWATPVPSEPDIEALVQRIIEILASILRDILGGIVS